MELEELYKELINKRNACGDSMESYTSGYRNGYLNGQIQLLERILKIKVDTSDKEE